MNRLSFIRFQQRNEYDDLPYYEEELNRARKALEQEYRH